MRLSNLLFRHAITVTPVKTTRDGIIVCVANGKGLLREELRVDDDKGLLTLCFNSHPLVTFHGDNYFCPTCRKLVSAGYGLHHDDEGLLSAFSDALNMPFVSLASSLEILKPLLGLLQDGYYLLSDMELFPTDGNGHFFWSIGPRPQLNPATCMVYDWKAGLSSTEKPAYMLPTQPPTLFNGARVQHYRGSTDTRALAYYLEGYLCALLDGHHKATAAALDGRTVKTLVLIPTRGMEHPDKRNNYNGKISFTEDAYLTRQDIGRAFNAFLRSYPTVNRVELSQDHQKPVEPGFDTFPWPQDILDTAKKYYDVHTLACIEWAGDISPQRIEAIISGKETLSSYELCHCIKALYATKGPDFIRFCISLFNNGCAPEAMYTMFPLLARIDSQEIEDFFIDFSIDDDGLRPQITKVVNGYLARKTVV